MTEDEKRLSHYESDAITFTMERKESCVVEYKGKASPLIVQEARKKALRALSKELSIPGFRKGKAPDALILSQYRERLQKEWQQILANLIYPECQKLTSIRPAIQEAQIHFKAESLDLEEGATFTFLFDGEPEVPKIDPSSIELEEIPKEVVDEARIERALQEIQDFFSKWERVEHSKAQEGDYALIDVDLIEELPPIRALSNARFELIKEKMAQWMFDLLIGMEVGETKEGISQPNADASEEEKEKNPPKKVSVHLLAIEHKSIPPVDDSLARLTGADNKETMVENLRKMLEKRADETQKQLYRDKIADYLLKHYPFPLPFPLVKRETDVRVRQFIEAPLSQERLAKMSEEEKRETLKEIQQRAESALRLFFLSRKLVDEEKIPLSPKDIEQEEKTLFSSQDPLYSFNARSQENKEIAYSRLILIKAEDLLIERAKKVPAKKSEESA